jgi:hypothetical protein
MILVLKSKRNTWYKSKYRKVNLSSQFKSKINSLKHQNDIDILKYQSQVS